MTKCSREIDVDKLIAQSNLHKGFRAEVLELTDDELVALFASLANLWTATFKKTRVDLPSFSTAKWTEFAKEPGLPLDAPYLQLVPFTTQKYRLPPLLHETYNILGVGKTSIVRRLIGEGTMRE